jgi:hypothetical protein
LSGGDSAPVSKTAIQECFETMDGAIYHGDPTDREHMKHDVATCERGIIALARMRPAIAEGPAKLYLSARILDRAATLSYMGLNDAATALREVKIANLYFRVASGLGNQSADYRAAALANVQLTRLQLQTLRTDSVAARRARTQTLALATTAARLPRKSAP